MLPNRALLLFLICDGCFWEESGGVVPTPPTLQIDGGVIHLGIGMEL
jgi:hypothetical protein